MIVHLNIVQDASMCSTCGGACCQSHPGLTLPRDWLDDKLEIDWSQIEDALRSRRWTLDGRKEVEYIRPVGSPSASIIHGLTCVMWEKDSGCSLDARSRPSGCLALIPQVGGRGELDCDYADAQDFAELAAREWRPYRSRLIEIGMSIHDEIVREKVA